MFVIIYSENQGLIFLILNPKFWREVASCGNERRIPSDLILNNPLSISSNQTVVLYSFPHQQIMS